MLEARHLTKHFGASQVLDDVCLTIEPATTTVVIGRSGSGKSTLLRALALLDPADSGDVLLDGREISRVRRRGLWPGNRERELASHRSELGMVFQRFNLFPHLTVLQNIQLGPRLVRKLDEKTARDNAMQRLADVGLADFAARYPSELSGGQQQRVAIARALSMRPKVMFFDEPTSALDAELVNEVLQTMRQLAADGMTMVVVTHELRFAREVAHDVIFMDQGRILEQAPPDVLFDNPQHASIHTFLSALR